MTKKILIVTTNFSEINKDIHTGVWMEEYSVPYLAFIATGYEVITASPNGGNSPIDENSLSCSNPMEWDDAAKNLKNTLKLSDIDYTKFDAIYIPGGHGPMFDLVHNQELNKIIEYMYKNDKVVAAVCHGVVALLDAKDDDGNHILKDKYVTGFSNKEEHIVKMEEFMLFLLEDKIKQTGAIYASKKPWSEHVEVADKVITGQNQNSSLLVAEKIIALLQ